MHIYRQITSLDYRPLVVPLIIGFLFPDLLVAVIMISEVKGLTSLNGYDFGPWLQDIDLSQYLSSGRMTLPMLQRYLTRTCNIALPRSKYLQIPRYQHLLTPENLFNLIGNMNTLLENIKRTTQAVIDGYGKWNIDSIMEYRDENCMQSLSPKSLGEISWNNAEYRKYFIKMMFLFHDFNVCSFEISSSSYLLCLTVIRH